MQTEFSRDLRDENRSIEDAARDRPGKPLRLRVQPSILTKGGQYKTWKDVSWTLECDSPAEAFAIRDTMRAFFETLNRLSPQEVSEGLRAMGVAKEVA